MRRILVALDETESSQRVAEFVNSFFDDDRFEVLAINVASAPIAWYPGDAAWGMAAPYAFPVMQPPESELYQQAREHGREAIEGSGLEPDAATVSFGDPVDAIRRMAEEHRVELVVVGTNEKGWWRRLVEGSVSERLVRDADRPVLVVH